MKSIPHPHFFGADNIPEAVRPDIVQAIDRNVARLTWDYQDIAYLFEVYNRYVAPSGEPERINCPACVMKVVGKMRQYAQQWRTASN